MPSICGRGPSGERGSSGERGATIVMVTHDPAAAARADRVIFLADGRLAGELRDPTPSTVAARLAGLEQAGRLLADVFPTALQPTALQPTGGAA